MAVELYRAGPCDACNGPPDPQLAQWMYSRCRLRTKFHQTDATTGQTDSRSGANLSRLVRPWDGPTRSRPAAVRVCLLCGAQNLVEQLVSFVHAAQGLGNAG